MSAVPRHMIQQQKSSSHSAPSSPSNKPPAQFPQEPQVTRRSDALNNLQL